MCDGRCCHDNGDGSRRNGRFLAYRTAGAANGHSQNDTLLVFPGYRRNSKYSQMELKWDVAIAAVGPGFHHHRTWHQRQAKFINKM
jgi:hypothetical protein